MLFFIGDIVRVVRKQNNSKNCFICGLENEFGVKAPFYEMEDNSVCSIFSFDHRHQSFPGRVHGGVIGAMLDELGFRALWVLEKEAWGVTLDMKIKYHKPVLYDAMLRGYGMVNKNTSKFVVATAKIFNENNELLAEASINYLKLPISKISKDVDAHEEMCYLIEDNVKEIDY